MTTTPEPTFDQNLAMIISQLPLQVRTFFVSGKIEIVTQNIVQKYQLHIDQGAVVEREIILLLLGLKNPTEFIRALAEEAKLDKKIVDGIVQDVNTQIFIPLRAEEMKAGGMKNESSVSATAPRPASVRPIGIPQVSPLGVTQPASHFHLENKIPLRSAPPMTQRTVPPPLKSMSGMARPVMIEAAKAIDNSKLLEDHEEPHIEFGKISTPVPAPARIAPLPQNLPGAIQSRIIPAGARASFIVAPKIESPTQPPASIPRFPTEVPMREGSTQPKPIVPTAPTAPVVSSVPPKPYSIDPYREPIE